MSDDYLELCGKGCAEALAMLSDASHGKIGEYEIAWRARDLLRASGPACVGYLSVISRAAVELVRQHEAKQLHIDCRVINACGYVRPRAVRNQHLGRHEHPKSYDADGLGLQRVFQPDK